MKTTIGPNQSLLDMVLMKYGTIEAAMQVAAVNNLSITSDVQTNDVLATPPGPASDASVSGYLELAGITIGTKGI